MNGSAAAAADQASTPLTKISEPIYFLMMSTWLRRRAPAQHGIGGSSRTGRPAKRSPRGSAAHRALTTERMGVRRGGDLPGIACCGLPDLGGVGRAGFGV
ncbi:hypothetical protein [Nocardia sp. NPDC004860]|uniref:hypothetical protein n=1 Tax=Nocardia sp. NPDC004860 TaxID=3154557 RepID=UPI0033AB5C78